MVKRLIVVCVLFCSIVFLTSGCAEKSEALKEHETELGDSARFTKQEIAKAVECVVDYFPNFQGCTLLRVSYNETLPNYRLQMDLHAKDPANTIVVFTDFYADESGENSGFNPDHTYEGWAWILVRDDPRSEWEIVNWGY